jgi:hypothetical protein
MSHPEAGAGSGTPGTALVPHSPALHRDEWADLRPAIRWFQRRRPVLVGALLMIAAQVAWRAQFLSHMYFYRDDFFNMDLAIESKLNWSYLSYIGVEHLMIGERAIIWVLVRMSAYNYGLAASVSLLFVLLADLAALRLLRTLFGERPGVLIPLAIYLLIPLTVPALGWWTVALESVPLQLAVLMAVNAQVHYVRSGRTWHLAAAIAWCVFALLFFEKGIVLPLLLFGVTSAYLTGGSSWLVGVVRTLRRYRREWLSLAVLLIAYGALLESALKTSSAYQPSVPTSAGAMITFAWHELADVLLPGAMGGPWQWLPLPGHWYALAGTPLIMSWLALLVAAAIICVSLMRRRTSWRAWALLAGWVVLADMVPVIIARIQWYPVLLGLETRYVADAAPVLAVCIGLAFLPLSNAGVGSSEPGQRTSIGPRGYAAVAEQRWRAALVALVVVFVGGSIWSTHAYEAVTGGSQARSFMGNAMAAVRLAKPGTRIVDSDMPTYIAIASDAHASRVIGDLARGKLVWIARPSGTIDGLRMFGPDGRLYPAWINGAQSGRPGTGGCWPSPHGVITVNFLRASPYLTTVLRLGYFWESSAPGVVQVHYGPNVYSLPLQPGLHSAFLQVRGSASGITIANSTGIKLCVGDAEAGNPAPLLTGPALPPLSQP